MNRPIPINDVECHLCKKNIFAVYLSDGADYHTCTICKGE